MLADRGARLVTLTGPGGSGKTRLAVAAAESLAHTLPDGVYFVSLAAVSNAEMVWNEIGDVLDLPVGQRARPNLLDRLTGMHTMLVLDNLEQVQGGGEAIRSLVEATKDLTVLVTSRRPLNLVTERQYAVAPLALPDDTATLTDAEASAAVQLFVTRAQAVRASFQLTADNAPTVAAICRHLDGLPLAIELAAARAKVLTPRDILGALDHPLELASSQVDRPARQRTLRETIDWSYRLLPQPAQTLFRRLGPFAGGADLAAVIANCEPDDVGKKEPLSLITELIDASLVSVSEQEDGETRFALLETIRSFALDALTTAGDIDDARWSHAAYFAKIAAPWDWRSMWTTREQATRGKRLLDLEHTNLEEALRWATSLPFSADPTSGAASEHIEIGLTLLSRAGRGWNYQIPAQSRLWLDALLETALGQHAAGVGSCLIGCAQVLLHQGDLPAALDYAQRSIAVLRPLDDPDLGVALLWLSAIHGELGDRPISRRACEEAIAYSRQSDDNLVLGRALTAMAILESEDDNWEAALLLLQESHQTFESIGADYWTASADHDLAYVLRRLGRVAEAHRLMSLGIHREARSLPLIDLIHSGEDYAAVLAAAGYSNPVPVLLAACHSARQAMGITPDRHQEREITSALATARSQLSSAAWDAEYTRGQHMNVLDALDQALSSTTGLRV